MTGNDLYKEYCKEYPLTQGYREVSYESWLQHQVVEYRSDVVDKNDSVVMPSRLTAENGAKDLLRGEFHETIVCHNEDGEPYEVKMPVEWTTIKEIYAKIVKHYGA